MRAYSRVAPQFWTGPTGRALRAAGKDCVLLALYFVTCPAALMTGIFYVPFPTLCFDTRTSPKRARAVLEVLKREDFAEYDFEASVVWLPEMARFQVGKDPKPDDKRIKGFLRELEAVSHPVFTAKFIEKYREPFQLDEETIRKVLRRGQTGNAPIIDAPSEPLRSPSEGPSKDHRSPEPLPEPEPRPEPEKEKARAKEEEVFRIWEENRGPLKKATKLNEDRRQKIRARLKEAPDLERWRSVVRRFAGGWASRQSWATLDFLIRNETNFLKVEEGTYDEATTREPRSGSRTLAPRRSSTRDPNEWDVAGGEVRAVDLSSARKPQ